ICQRFCQLLLDSLPRAYWMPGAIDDQLNSVLKLQQRRITQHQAEGDDQKPQRLPPCLANLLADEGAERHGPARARTSFSAAFYQINRSSLGRALLARNMRRSVCPLRRQPQVR